MEAAQFNPFPKNLNCGAWVGLQLRIRTRVETPTRSDAGLVHCEGHIPVITCAPGHADEGALIGLGADYVEVGRAEGELAADLRSGRDPAAVPIVNLTPDKLALNLSRLRRLRGSGRFLAIFWSRQLSSSTKRDSESRKFANRPWAANPPPYCPKGGASTWWNW